MSIVNGLYYGHGSDTISMVVDVLVDKWVGDTAPFTNTVRVPKASPDRIFTYNLYPATVTGSTDEEDAAMACITGVTVGNECITFTCDTEKPQTSIKVSLYSQTPIIGESGQVSRDVLGSSDISDLGDGTLKSAIKYVSSAVPDIIVKQNITIPTSAWTMDDATGMYKASITDTDILNIHMVNINIASSSLTVAAEAKMSNVTESYDGGVNIYATNIPTADLSCDYMIMGTGSETFQNAIKLVGSVDNLNTVTKTSIVEAINETYAKATEGPGVGTSDISELGDGTLTGAIDYVFSNMTDVLISRDVSIPTSAWILDDTTGLYKASITDARIKAIHIVNVNFKDTSIEIANAAGMSNITESYDGGVSLFTTTIPTDAIVCDYVIMGTGAEEIKNTENMIGDITGLNTTNKATVVDAINELDAKIAQLQTGTPVLSAVTTTQNDDGSITETYSDGGSITTTFNDDGSITQVATYPDGTTSTKTTTFDADGNPVETIS